MKLLTPSEVRSHKNSQIVSVSNRYRLFVLLPIAVFALAVALFQRRPGTVGVNLLWPVFLMFAGVYYFKFIHRHIRRTPWVLILDREGLFINVPSRLFSAFEKHVLYISLDEIKAVQITRRKATISERYGSEDVSVKLKFLDIYLFAPLVELLFGQSEQHTLTKNDFPAATKDAETLLAHLHSVQVTLQSPMVIRIRVDNLALEILSAIHYFQKNQIRVNEDRHEQVYARGKDSLQMETITAQLALEGDRAEAVRLAQKIYGIKESEAKQLINQLSD